MISEEEGEEGEERTLGVGLLGDGVPGFSVRALANHDVGLWSKKESVLVSRRYSDQHKS